MSTSDKIGLLPGFGWFAGHGFWLTFGICMLVSPLGLWIIQLVIERRAVSLSREDNYLSFFPGDVFLGAAATSFLALAAHLPSEQHWYNSTWWHSTVLLCCIVGGLYMTYIEYRRGQYALQQILSPTKLYHLALLGLYGYVIVSTGFAVLFGGAFFSRWLCTVLVVIGLAVWGFLFWFDQNAIMQTEEQQFFKSRARHSISWTDNWRRNPRTQAEPEVPLGMLPTFDCPSPREDSQED